MLWDYWITLVKLLKHFIKDVFIHLLFVTIHSTAYLLYNYHTRRYFFKCCLFELVGVPNRVENFLEEDFGDTRQKSIEKTKKVLCGETQPETFKLSLGIV